MEKQSRRADGEPRAEVEKSGRRYETRDGVIEEGVCRSRLTVFEITPRFRLFVFFAFDRMLSLSLSLSVSLFLCVSLQVIYTDSCSQVCVSQVRLLIGSQMLKSPACLSRYLIASDERENFLQSFSHGSATARPALLIRRLRKSSRVFGNGLRWATLANQVSAPLRISGKAWSILRTASSL